MGAGPRRRRLEQLEVAVAVATGATPRGDGPDFRAEARLEQVLVGFRGPDAATTPLVAGLFLGLLLREAARRAAAGGRRAPAAPAPAPDPLVDRALGRWDQLEAAGRALPAWREEPLSGRLRALLDRLGEELTVAAMLGPEPGA